MRTGSSRGTVTPAAPTRDAATVVLLRDTGAGPEVWVLRRTPSMPSFPGMTVFPGGGVDGADLAADDLGWAGPPPDAWTGPLSASAALARGLVCAAVRETFEESGVLLAGDPTTGRAVADTASPEWETRRRALPTRSTSLSAVLRGAGLVLRADLLRPWAHWITPLGEPRRYDTRFFVAALPAGQDARHVGGEASAAGWARPGELLDRLAAGELTMVPPTAVTLAELSGYESVGAVVAAAMDRRIVPVLPRDAASAPGDYFGADGDAAAHFALLTSPRGSRASGGGATPRMIDPTRDGTPSPAGKQSKAERDGAPPPGGSTVSGP